MKQTSWDKSDAWYDSIVGEKGHYYHQSVIFPEALRLLQIRSSTQASLLDLGCGNGVLARQLPAQIEYTGVDLAKGLLDAAKRETKRGVFLLSDATKPLPIEKKDFDIACFILSLQNMEDGQGAIIQAATHLKSKGQLLIVLNHPCFRIPRQSSWGIDEEAKLQYRRVNRYLSPLKIPIQTNPGKGAASENTLSFHHPLSTYTTWLQSSGFAIKAIEEWRSDKKSEGHKAKMEDRAREEFPLFLAILGEKR
ncbi:MAG TPA: class I SAM-dependent methyltransferase [Chlamydiales bacterium]|jgi:SAM-dependent methyltransferase